MAWQLGDGRLVPVRCGATNRCWYCARLAAVENMVVLQLDARENVPPTAVMTLTTVEVGISNVKLRKSIEQVTRALRRRRRELEYCGFVEWTTGKGPRSGGQRRVHVHFLLKGLRSGELAAAEKAVRVVWRARTGAHRVEVRELRAAGGATAYLALHHEKTAQGPPPGWRGKRLRPSRGYFGGPGMIKQRRLEARALLLDRRLRRIAERAVSELLGDELNGLPGPVYDDLLERALERAAAEQRDNPPLLVRVRVRERLNPETGELDYEFGRVLGPVEPRRGLPRVVGGPTIRAEREMPRRRVNAPGPALEG